MIKTFLHLRVLLFGLLLLGGCEKRHTATAPQPATAPPLATAESGTTSLSAGPVHVGPAGLYPNPSLTVGKVDTLELADLTARYTTHCPTGHADCTYSQSHRNVPARVHKAVYDEYSVPADKRNIQNGEVDHLYPMCAGGSNDPANLWYQPATNLWKGKNFGFHEKVALRFTSALKSKLGAWLRRKHIAGSRWIGWLST